MFAFLVLGVCLLFLRPTWLAGFVSRQLFSLSVIIPFNVYRVISGDELAILRNTAMIISLSLVAELALYLNLRTEASLFHRLKISEQQQRSMADVLNAVPQSVIICSKQK